MQGKTGVGAALISQLMHHLYIRASFSPTLF
jgi:hypothetical protein